MIPAIRQRIDEANNDLEIGDGDHGHWIRTSIPTSELATLSELRKRQHIQRARENTAEILRRLETEDRGNVIQVQNGPIDEERSFGLPQGEDVRKIWGQILDHVKDLPDIVQIRDACPLFRELLDEKYKIFRLSEVILKARRRLGMKSLLTLRLVCRSTKAAVDELYMENKLDSFWFAETFTDEFLCPECIRVPRERFSLGQADLNLLKRTVEKLEEQALPVDAFGIRKFDLSEYPGGDSDDPLMVLFSGEGRERQDPLLLEFRDMFQRFLELVGSSMRSFKYFSCADNLFINDQLRIWLPLMPNLENLTITGMDNDDDTMVLENPPLFQPFPSCARLKRYRHQGTGFCAPFVAEIFRANPWITDVYLSWDETMDKIGETELSALQSTLNMLKLERFHVYGVNTVPPLQFEFRFDWPLKYLSLTMEDWEEDTREAIPSRTLFKFINTFTNTLKELTMNWKIRDTGGYLDLPKVTKVLWKFRPEFLDFDFLVALENLQFLDVDVGECHEINGSIERVKEFIIEEKKVPPMFPALRRIRARIVSVKTAVQMGQFVLALWRPLW